MEVAIQTVTVSRACPVAVELGYERTRHGFGVAVVNESRDAQRTGRRCSRYDDIRVGVKTVPFLPLDWNPPFLPRSLTLPGHLS